MPHILVARKDKKKERKEKKKTELSPRTQISAFNNLGYVACRSNWLLTIVLTIYISMQPCC